MRTWGTALLLAGLSAGCLSGGTALAVTGAQEVPDGALPFVSVTPHASRDIVLAELSAPVKNVTPVALSSSAPQEGKTFRIAGYGRTSAEWIPKRMHAGQFTVGAVGQQAGTGHEVTAELVTDAGQELSVEVDPDGSTSVGLRANPDNSPTMLLRLQIDG